MIGVGILGSPVSGRLAIAAVVAATLVSGAAILELGYCPVIVSFPAAYGYRYVDLLGGVIFSEYMPASVYTSFLDSLQAKLNRSIMAIRFLALDCTTSEILSLEPLMAILALALAYIGLRYLSGFEQALVMLTRRDMLAYISLIILASEAPIVAALCGLQLWVPGPGLGGYRLIGVIALALLVYLLAYMIAFAATGSASAPFIVMVLVAVLLGVTGYPVSGFLWNRPLLKGIILLGAAGAALYRVLGSGRLWLG